MRRRVLALTGVALGLQLLVAAAPKAGADDGGGGFVDDTGTPTAVAHDDGEHAGQNGSVGAVDCQWNVVIADDFAFAIYDEGGARRYSETGTWLERVCDGQPVEVGGSFIIPEGGAVDPAALAADAIASVPILAPPIETSPSADRRLYTQVPTWLWLEGDWWRGYSATAIAGRVTSTATATPTRAEWTPGDGDKTTCRGPGVEWRRGLPESATYCSHIYRHSSAGEDDDSYTLGVTVWFEVAWTSNTGQGGSLASISRAASRSVQVGEIQAVETE